MKEKEAKVYDLLSERAFDDLDAVDQQLALEVLGSREAYDKLRELALAGEKSFEEAKDQAPPELKARVMDEFEQAKPSSGSSGWWKYAAAAAVLILAVWVFLPSDFYRDVQLAEKTEKDTKTKEQGALEPSKEEGPSETEESPATADNEESPGVPSDQAESPSDRADLEERNLNEDRSEESLSAERPVQAAQEKSERDEFEYDSEIMVAEDVAPVKNRSVARSMSEAANGNSASPYSLKALGGPVNHPYIAY